ncbi:MAG: SPOR domain-containing protein [Emergencia sp.]|nr:SPOR domain-containing protein [Emergencia sp.]
MNRRKIRRYRRARGNSGMKFVGFLGIMIVAVICGYLTARFVIAPLLGYDTQVLKLDFPSRLTAVLEEDNSKEEQDESAEKDADVDGYALQFGLFSTRERAEELVSDLADEGIVAEIREVDGEYKVVSALFETKKEALDKLKKTNSKRVSDIFITAIE